MSKISGNQPRFGKLNLGRVDQSHSHVDATVQKHQIRFSNRSLDLGLDYTCSTRRVARFRRVQNHEVDKRDHFFGGATYCMRRKPRAQYQDNRTAPL